MESMTELVRAFKRPQAWALRLVKGGGGNAYETKILGYPRTNLGNCILASRMDSIRSSGCFCS